MFNAPSQKREGALRVGTVTWTSKRTLSSQSEQWCAANIFFIILYNPPCQPIKARLIVFRCWGWSPRKKVSLTLWLPFQMGRTNLCSSSIVNIVWKKCTDHSTTKQKRKTRCQVKKTASVMQVDSAGLRWGEGMARFPNVTLQGDSTALTKDAVCSPGWPGSTLAPPSPIALNNGGRRGWLRVNHGSPHPHQYEHDDHQDNDCLKQVIKVGNKAGTHTHTHTGATPKSFI